MSFYSVLFTITTTFFIILLINYNKSQIVITNLTLIITIAVFSIFFLFLNSIFSKKRKKEKTVFKSFIDSLDKLVIIRSSNKIISLNKAFLNFFEVESVNEFIKKYKCLTNCCLTNEGCLNIDLSTINDLTVDKMNSLDKPLRVIEMRNNDGELHRLKIKISKLDENSDLYSISLTDITKENNFEQKANIDALTNTFSRHKFHELYGLEFGRSLRYFNPLSILFIDIDHFKKVNDTYGHDTGDEVLKTFSKLITRNVREYDKLARWGGEEFILMLPQTTVNEAYKFAEKIRKIIESHKFDKIENLTCSIGLSSLKKGDNTQNLIKRADVALYKAKNSGRNRTIIEI